MLEKSVLETRKEVLGVDNPTTLVTISNLTLTYLRRGKYTEARELGVQAMEISKRILSQESPQIVFIMSNLAQVYFMDPVARRREARCAGIGYKFEISWPGTSRYPNHYVFPRVGICNPGTGGGPEARGTGHGDMFQSVG
jgi:hypothetical protein